MSTRGGDLNFHDLTNTYRRGRASTGLPTPPSERKRVRQLEFDVREKKRLKFSVTAEEKCGTDIESESSSESEEEDLETQRRRTSRYSVYALQNRMMSGGFSRSLFPCPGELCYFPSISRHRL